MSQSFARIVFTPLVKEQQTIHGSRRQYQRVEESGAAGDHLTDAERGFIADRDSFYLASVGETGWPYIQHRGGPNGFLHVLDDRTLAFADYRGNKQYISMGNLLHDDRVALFLMDLSISNAAQDTWPGSDSRRGTSERANRKRFLTEGARRRRTCDRNSSGSLRLELSVVHHAALYRGASRPTIGANTSPRR